MNIQKIVIQNFKCFDGNFALDLKPGINILVGDNEAGKSTIIEAINLALTGWIQGKHLKTDLTESLFNNSCIQRYLDSLNSGNPIEPPHILIELYFNIEDPELDALFRGSGNSLKSVASGIVFKVAYNNKFDAEYQFLVSSEDHVGSIPIEYYDYSWSSFARDESVTPRTIPIKPALIDSSGTRYQNGSDVYISTIIRDLLSDEVKVKVSQAHRKLRDSFANESVIEEINTQLIQQIVSDKKLELSVDVSTKTAWETSLVSYLNDVPFRHVGKGEQCLIKTRLALAKEKAKEANVILLEEPENHLSHSRLNKLINFIRDAHSTKQIIVTTHSSFIANKLGLDSLILLKANELSGLRKQMTLQDLENSTRKYFQKLAGYDTLRLILCRHAILVEGPSDELVVQKAYSINNAGKLPIEDGVDVISVGTSFLRFLEIAKLLEQPTTVVTDNDGDYERKITVKYEEYSDLDHVLICSCTNNALNTLEPNIVDAHIAQLNILHRGVGMRGDAEVTREALIDYMLNHKTDSALGIFESEENILFPQYILDAISSTADE